MQDLNESIQIILPPPSQFQDNLETRSTDVNTESMVDVPTFEMSTQTSYGLVVISFIHIYIDIDVKRLILKSSIIIKCMYISLYTYYFFYMFYMFTCVSDLTMHFDKLCQLIKYLLVTNDYLIDALTI